jgi:radical SAM protein
MTTDSERETNMPHPHAGRSGKRPNFNIDYDQTPFLVIWETTQACQLACKHCRAEAIDVRHPGELTTEEGKALMDAVKAMGTPIFICSGGDPLQRDDLEELIRHGKSRGLRMGTIPAATPRLTRDRIVGLKEAGLDQMAMSLEASTAALHDGFRRVEGSFDKTMEGCAWARELGIPLQINTCFSTWNLDEFDATAALVEKLGVVFWEVFFLVPTGRGADMDLMTPDQYEMMFEKLYQLQKRVDFIVKVTEGQHYRRYVVEAERQAKGSAHGQQGPTLTDMLARSEGPGQSIGMAPKGVNAGKGFCFVSHTGEIMPSGFLPIEAGNVRTHSLADVYRNSELFVNLRNLDLLTGRCGICEYNNLCGGSRSRAYAMTGDMFATDPGCSYIPAATGTGV